MLFTSTRTIDLDFSFSHAVLDCIPEDGGVFVPSPLQIADLRNWIAYINKETTFKSIAGTLTSALMKDEISPILCEKIATEAFSFEPKIKQIDEQFFHLDLTNGFTGCHRDYGVSYLCSYLEIWHEMNGGNSIFLDFTHGELGALLAQTLRGKKHIKAVLLYSGKEVVGISKDDLFVNGGNLYPVCMDKTEEEIEEGIRGIFSDKEFSKEHHLTVANTTNICRLMAQVFYFPYSFSRIKHKINGDIYYAVDAGNYATLMAGLYSWRFALPVQGFYLPATPGLCADTMGNPILLDSFVSFDKRDSVSPSVPANLERLEAFFGRNQMMMRNFIYPIEVTEKDIKKAAQELFTKYGLYVDESTARSYATIMLHGDEIYDEGGAFVLVSQKHAGLTSDFCRHVLGESPEIPELVRDTMKKFDIEYESAENFDDVINIIKKIKFD